MLVDCPWTCLPLCSNCIPRSQALDFAVLLGTSGPLDYFYWLSSLGLFDKVISAVLGWQFEGRVP